MSIDKDYIDSINDKQKYDNFSEEVEIISETAAGKMAIYTVKNKNSVTFQKVPGQPGLENRGFMGFVQGDRARPIMLSGSVKVTETESVDNTVTDLFPVVDIAPSIFWDVQLVATRDGAPETETKSSYILVL